MAVIIDPLAVDLKLGLGEHQPDGLPADFARPVVVRAMSVPRRLMTMTSGLPALDLPGLDTAQADETDRLQFRRCFRHQLLLPRPYLVLTKPLRLDIQCQRGASVKIGWKYLDD